jgi:U3 small nucleolar RNA-associated protein 22
VIQAAEPSDCLACRKVAKQASKALLRKDVLVGFHAVEDVFAALTERLGHCAVFCIDDLGGNVIGIKWKPKAWLPGPFHVATAHTRMPCVAGGSQGLFVTDAVAVVQEILHLGRGIVADVVLSC